MKKTLVVFASLLAINSAFAGFIRVTCDGYRISQDTNQNVQRFHSEDNTLRVNGEELSETEWIDGSLVGLEVGYPATAKFKSKDGKGDYSVVISALSTIASVQGHASIGRDHDVDVFQVTAEVSRNGKKHEFAGTCTSEVLSTCGGACKPESEDRDTL